MPLLQRFCLSFLCCPAVIELRSYWYSYVLLIPKSKKLPSDSAPLDAMTFNSPLSHMRLSCKFLLSATVCLRMLLLCVWL